MKTTTYSHQTAPHISYIYTHTLSFQIKSLTLLKQITFPKQIHVTHRQLDVIYVIDGDGYALPAADVSSFVLLGSWFC